MDASTKYGILKFKRECTSNVEDEVAVKLPVAIYVNGKPLSVLYAALMSLES